MFKYNLIMVALTLFITNVYAFGSDMCFKQPTFARKLIHNCIQVPDSCRTSNLNASQLMHCKKSAMINALLALSGFKAFVGARSLMHGDATYLITQLIGFSPWQAYETMIYDSAADSKKYVPFNQQGRQLLTNQEMIACRDNWDANMPNHCLLLTPVLNGIYKFNIKTGGMLLHWHALYSKDGQPLPPPDYPTDYFSTKNIKKEPILTNFRAWVYEQRVDACAAGITKNMSSNSSPCAAKTKTLTSPMSVFSFGFSALKLRFKTILGQLIINKNAESILDDDHGFKKYISPDEVAYAKLGIFLHILADRVSHHLCIDHSYYYETSDGNYASDYSAVACAQGSHFLRHVWEQGTLQTDQNLAPEFQTMRPALEAVYDQVMDYAHFKGIKINNSINKKELIDNLINVLQITNPQKRLDSMVALTESYQLLPLPGHGTMANESIDEWFKLAGAPGT